MFFTFLISIQTGFGFLTAIVVTVNKGCARRRCRGKLREIFEIRRGDRIKVVIEIRLIGDTSILDGSLLQNLYEEVRRSNSNQDCILQELKLMNRNIETLCQQRQYIFPSTTPVKVPVDINIHKIIESYETSKKEDYVGYDVKKQKW